MLGVAIPAIALVRPGALDKAREPYPPLLSSCLLLELLVIVSYTNTLEDDLAVML